MVVNGAGTGGKARIDGRRRVAARPAPRRSSRTQGRRGGQERTKDLRDNGWFVFFAPRDNPQIAGVVFLEHGVHGANAARGRASRARRRFSPRRTAGRCRRRRARRTACSIIRTRRPGAQPGARRPSRVPTTRLNVRTTTLLPHRLGAARRDPRARRDWGGDDLQRDVGPTRARRTAMSPSSTRIVLGLFAMVVMLSSTTGRSPTSRTSFTSAILALLLIYVLLFGAVRGGSRRWIPTRLVQPAAVGVCEDRCRAGPRQVLRREPRRAVTGPIWRSAAR